MLESCHRWHVPAVQKQQEWPHHGRLRPILSTGTQVQPSPQRMRWGTAPITGWPETDDAKYAATVSSQLKSRLRTSTKAGAALSGNDSVVLNVPKGPSPMGSFDTAEALNTAAPHACSDSGSRLNQLRCSLESTGRTEVEGGLTTFAEEPDAAALRLLGSRSDGGCHLLRSCLLSCCFLWRCLFGCGLLCRRLWRCLLRTLTCHASSDGDRFHCGIKSITAAVFRCVDRCWSNRYSRRAAGHWTLRHD